MEPISATIVTMLIKAAQPTAERAFLDAYLLLRRTLISRYGPRMGLAVENLERQPGSPELRDQLVAQLRVSGADRDQEIVNLTHKLAYIVENLTLPTERVDRVERAKRRAGSRALQTLLADHVSTVLRARQSYRVEDSELLTANLGSSTLPSSVRGELTALHATMRELIGRIATELENDAYRDAETALHDDRLGLSNRDKALALINADRTLHTSYQTLQLTVEYFREFNANILAKIENEASAQRQGTMMLGNAVMIYELADFVIRFIRSFAPHGVEELEELFRSSQARIERIRTEHQELERKVSLSQVSSEVREQTLQDIRQRYDALDVMDREWASYIDEVKQLSGMVDQVRGRLETLEIIRDNAAGQISTLQEIALLRFLKQNTGMIKGTVDALQEFRLAPLTPSRVRRLLGV